MYYLATKFRTILLGMMLLVGAAYSSAAQTQFGSTVQSFSNAISPNSAADANLATAATLVPPLLGGGAQLRLGFASPVQPGQQTGLFINVGGTLATSVFNSININTYSGTSTTPTQTFPLNTLVTLALLNSSTTDVQIPTTMAFDQVELVTTGVANVLFNIRVFEAFSGVVPTGPLPVELTAFQGKATTTGVLLSWQTASEHYNDHFVVERATGAGADFRAIGQVAGAGNSTQLQSYQFTDGAPGLLNYYRLRQVDEDGKETLSPVVVVKAQPMAGLVAVYPNPASETLTITGLAGTQVGVYDQLGRQVRSASLSLAASPQLDIRSLPNGVYYVRDAAMGTSTKFVKVTDADRR